MYLKITAEFWRLGELEQLLGVCEDVRKVSNMPGLRTFSFSDCNSALSFLEEHPQLEALIEEEDVAGEYPGVWLFAQSQYHCAWVLSDGDDAPVIDIDVNYADASYVIRDSAAGNLQAYLDTRKAVTEAIVARTAAPMGWEKVSACSAHGSVEGCAVYQTSEDWWVPAHEMVRLGCAVQSAALCWRWNAMTEWLTGRVIEGELCWRLPLDYLHKEDTRS